MASLTFAFLFLRSNFDANSRSIYILRHIVTNICSARTRASINEKLVSGTVSCCWRFITKHFILASVWLEYNEQVHQSSVYPNFCQTFWVLKLSHQGYTVMCSNYSPRASLQIRWIIPLNNHITSFEGKLCKNYLGSHSQYYRTIRFKNLRLDHCLSTTNFHASGSSTYLKGMHGGYQ